MPFLSIKIEAAKQVVKSIKNLDAAEKYLSKAESSGIDFITLWDEKYPDRLRKISDPPTGLYIRGIQSPLYDYAVAVVGTRNASDFGRNIAFKISKEIAATGVTIVSGLAMGIDTASHEGTLQAGGRTVAVLGCGIDVIYPPSNKKLYSRIIHQGAVISEHPPGTEPNPGYFPRRNRIISGLSLGVVVVEAGLKSGALITANLAIEQEREVFAVPGAAGSLRSAGVNGLIRDGVAQLVENGTEVMEHLRSQLAPMRNIAATLALPDMNDVEKELYDVLENGACLVDDVIRKLNSNAIEVNRLLTTMQLKGLVRQLPGARVERA